MQKFYLFFYSAVFIVHLFLPLNWGDDAIFFEKSSLLSLKEFLSGSARPIIDAFTYFFTKFQLLRRIINPFILIAESLILSKYLPPKNSYLKDRNIKPRIALSVNNCCWCRVYRNHFKLFMGSNIWINQPDFGAETNEQSKNKLLWKKTTFRFENVVFLSFLIAIWLAAGAAAGAPSTALFARVKREYHRKHYRRSHGGENDYICGVHTKSPPILYTRNAAIHATAHCITTMPAVSSREPNSRLIDVTAATHGV